MQPLSFGSVHCVLARGRTLGDLLLVWMKTDACPGKTEDEDLVDRWRHRIEKSLQQLSKAVKLFVSRAELCLTILSYTLRIIST